MIKQAVKSLLFPKGIHPRRIVGGELKGFRFNFDLRCDTQQWRGVYEVVLQHWLRDHVRPGGICLDIGASDGYFALLMAKLAGPLGRIYAFEPSDGALRIAPNLDLNRDRSIAPVEVIQRMAVSSAAQTDGDSSRISIDDFVEEKKLPSVDVIKIDVDGGEVEVFNGMLETVRRFHPNLFIEVHSEALRDEVIKLAEGNGYRLTLKPPPPHELRIIPYNVFLFS